MNCRRKSCHQRIIDCPKAARMGSCDYWRCLSYIHTATGRPVADVTVSGRAA